MAFREMKAAPALQPARPASPPPPPPDFSIRTLDGASWSEDSSYMRWTLPVNTGRVVGGIPRNF